MSAPIGEASGQPGSTRVKGGGRFGAALVLLGGIAAIVGAFLEWMKITPNWADPVALNGWTLSDDAKIIAALGGLSVVIAVVVIAGSLRRVMRIAAAVLGIVIVGIGAYDSYDILKKLPDALREIGIDGVEIVAPGIGLILILAGGAVVILGSLAMTGGRKEATSVQTPPGTAAAPSSAPLTPSPGSIAGGFASAPGSVPQPSPFQ